MWLLILATRVRLRLAVVLLLFVLALQRGFRETPVSRYDGYIEIASREQEYLGDTGDARSEDTMSDASWNLPDLAASLSQFMRHQLTESSLLSALHPHRPRSASEIELVAHWRASTDTKTTLGMVVIVPCPGWHVPVVVRGEIRRDESLETSLGSWTLEKMEDWQLPTLGAESQPSWSAWEIAPKQIQATRPDSAAGTARLILSSVIQSSALPIALEESALLFRTAELVVVPPEISPVGGPSLFWDLLALPGHDESPIRLLVSSRTSLPYVCRFLNLGTSNPTPS
jgi:hypothetical protein